MVASRLRKFPLLLAACLAAVACDGGFRVRGTAIAACASNVAAAAAPREITLIEARALVTAALQGPGTKTIPGFEVEHFDHDDSPDFFFLSALWSPPTDFQGSV